MSITLLFGCGQIEMTVRDLQAASAFMESVLGAGEIEKQLAKEINQLFPNGELKVAHYDCGEATFQFNQPSRAADYRGQTSVHQAYLDRVGPCVTNLNFFVDDSIHAHELLTAMGAETYLEGPSSAAPCLADYGPENTRPGAESRKFYFIGSRHLIGLDFEMMEPNFQRFTKQKVQYPCFVQPRPEASDRNLRLLRVTIVVADLEETYRNLVKLFAPASRSKAYDVRMGSLARAFRIGLGGIELEYCQLLSEGGVLADRLHRDGPGVVAIEFGARDLDLVLQRVRGSTLHDFMEESDALGGEVLRSNCGRYRIASRDLIGFDVVLEQLDERLFPANA